MSGRDDASEERGEDSYARSQCNNGVGEGTALLSTPITAPFALVNGHDVPIEHASKGHPGNCNRHDDFCESETMGGLPAKTARATHSSHTTNRVINSLAIVMPVIWPPAFAGITSEKTVIYRAISIRLCPFVQHPAVMSRHCAPDLDSACVEPAGTEKNGVSPRRISTLRWPQSCC